MFKTGPGTFKGNRSSMPEVSADDPIYKRGFAIGVTRTTPSTPSPVAPAIPAESASNQEPAPSPDSTPKRLAILFGP